METKKNELRKTARTAAVFALVCVMGLSCLTGCTGTKKQPTDNKPKTSQSQQLNPGKKTDDNKKTDPGKKTDDSKKTDPGT